jgi:hypothetical protein
VRHQPTRVNLAVATLSITARIDKLQELTEVEIQLIEPAKKVEFKFPLTDVDRVEAAIAQKLQLSRQEVRKLTRYIIISSSPAEGNRATEPKQKP